MAAAFAGLDILGGPNTQNGGDAAGLDGGNGTGGTGGSGTINQDSPLTPSGGGGGGGLRTDGIDGGAGLGGQTVVKGGGAGRAFVNGGAGGHSPGSFDGNGGFGGGSFNGGTGGNSVDDLRPPPSDRPPPQVAGLGGSSFDAGTNPLVTLAANAGDGSVVITLVAAAPLTEAPVPEPASLALLAGGLLGLGLVRRWPSRFAAVAT